MKFLSNYPVKLKPHRMCCGWKGYDDVVSSRFSRIPFRFYRNRNRKWTVDYIFRIISRINKNISIPVIYVSMLYYEYYYIPHIIIDSQKMWKKRHFPFSFFLQYLTDIEHGNSIITRMTKIHTRDEWYSAVLYLLEMILHHFMFFPINIHTTRQRVRLLGIRRENAKYAHEDTRALMRWCDNFKCHPHQECTIECKRVKHSPVLQVKALGVLTEWRLKPCQHENGDEWYVRGIAERGVCCAEDGWVTGDVYCSAEKAIFIINKWFGVDDK